MRTRELRANLLPDAKLSISRNKYVEASVHLHCDARRLPHYAAIRFCMGDQGSPDRRPVSRSTPRRQYAGQDQSHTAT
jgi:hypothetical protein